tara:strand:+ start:863 stop:1018 length:156 start_codon:yes stop_codon:yes gene_type:complete
MSLIKTWLHQKMAEEITGTSDIKELTTKDYQDFIKDFDDKDTELLRYIMFG